MIGKAKISAAGFLAEDQEVQFCPVQPLDRLGRRARNMTDDSAEILFQSFLQGAIVGNSGMGSNVHSFALSIQHFLCRPRRRPPSKVPSMMVLERLSWHVACSNHASFRLISFASKVKLHKSLVASILLYGCETLTLLADSEKRI